MDFQANAMLGGMQCAHFIILITRDFDIINFGDLGEAPVGEISVDPSEFDDFGFRVYIGEITLEGNIAVNHGKPRPHSLKCAPSLIELER